MKYSVQDNTHTRRVQVVPSTLAAEVVLARRSDSLLSRIITDTAIQDILATLTVLLQNQIGMICDLTHLHDKTEDVGIVVEENTLSNICLELSGTAVHDAASEVILFLAKELTVNIDLLRW